MCKPIFLLISGIRKSNFGYPIHHFLGFGILSIESPPENEKEGEGRRKIGKSSPLKKRQLFVSTGSSLTLAKMLRAEKCKHRQKCTKKNSRQLLNKKKFFEQQWKQCTTDKLFFISADTDIHR